MEASEKEYEDKLSMMEDAALEICSYVKIAQAYINKNLAISEMVHLGLIIDKMEENTEIFEKVFEVKIF